jgi:hypothetical protein
MKLNLTHKIRNAKAKCDRRDSLLLAGTIQVKRDKIGDGQDRVFP